jgi:VIT1/CCC1 family predicted Fe2+/Mn2+ transporter
VFGVNDGLVSNACLILGIAGATASAAEGNSTIILAGAAGLVAGAFAMAAGEYVSVRTQREFYEYQIGLERDELATTRPPKPRSSP